MEAAAEIARAWLPPLLDAACDRLAFVLQSLFDLAMERSHTYETQQEHKKKNAGYIIQWGSSLLSSESGAKVWLAHGLILGAAVAAAIGAYFLRRSKGFLSRIIGIIPARYASSRFEGKPLVHILGKPMIQRTWESQVSFKSRFCWYEYFSPLYLFCSFLLCIHTACKLFYTAIVMVNNTSALYQVYGVFGLPAVSGSNAK